MNRLTYFALALTFPAAPVLNAQAGPLGHDIVTCLKVQPGKATDFKQFENDIVKKVITAETDQGDMAAWFLLRTVFPTGEEARCDYIAVSAHSDIPPTPQGPEHLADLLRKAQTGLSPEAYLAKAAQVARIVSTEMWRTVVLVGEVQKGDYLYMNFMKVHDAPNYLAFEQNIWKPMGEAWVKDGTFHAWMVMVPFLPSGVGLPYQLVSADVFPTWEQALKGEEEVNTWKRVHPEMTLQQAEEKLVKLRDLDRRYFLTVQEKILPGQPRAAAAGADK